MRYMPAILARLFKPAPLMDAHTEARRADPIARDLEAAISEHERVASEIRDDYAVRLRDTIDDLLKRMGKQDDPSG